MVPGVEARDGQGAPVRYDDESASAWDVTGGMCFLFGWQRACELFPQLEQHVTGRPRNRRFVQSPAIDSMRVLQDFNDSGDTTYDVFVGHLQSMPVWRTNREPTGVE